MRNSALKNLPLAGALLLLLVASVPLAPVQGQTQSPSPEHQALAKEVGSWDAVTKVWMTPEGKPLVGEGEETNTMFGSMWLLSSFKSEMGGIPFEGRGQFGYDPVAKKYIGTWIDSMGPYLYTMEGTYDQATHTTTMLSTGRDIHSGKITTTKNITRFTGDDTKVFEIHAPVPDQEGKWWKMLEISYKRRK